MLVFKKRGPSQTENTTPAKRAKKVPPEAPQSVELNPYPKKIICWNCNGLSPRLRAPGGIDTLRKFMADRSPDVLFLSEVRLPAAHNAGSRRPTTDTTYFRSHIRVSDSSSCTDHDLVAELLRSEECASYKAYFSLANTKYAGTAMLLNTKTTELPVSVRFNMATLDVKKSVHDCEGRVIVAKFPQFSILHTYVPNNGWSDTKFERRRNWDDSVLSFMKRKRDAGVRVLWIGDLNVAPSDCDLSHPTYFRSRTDPGRDTPPGVDNVGQPGCTVAERQRFSAILEAGDMADAYRHMYGDEDGGEMTWRGAPRGMYGDMGMRIDHCIASRSLLSRIENVEILGCAEGRIGFMGSDHCPVLITCSDGIEVAAKQTAPRSSDAETDNKRTDDATCPGTK